MDLNFQQEFISFAKEWIFSYLSSKKIKFIFGSLDNELIVKFIWNNNSYEFKSIVEIKKFFNSEKINSSCSYEIVKEDYFTQYISENAANVIFSVIVQKYSETNENAIIKLDGSMIVKRTKKVFKIIYLCLDNWLSQYIENFSQSEKDKSILSLDDNIDTAFFKYNDKHHFIRNNENNRVDYDFTGKRILLAEDNELTKEITQTILELKNMLVDIADSGEEAVDKFCENDTGYYDAIIIDIMMPNKTGLDAANKIRNSNREDAKTIPIISMSGNAFSEDVSKSFRIGMNEHILKPIDPKKLYNILDKLILKNSKI